MTTNDDVEALACVIWEASRADEGTISATGARHVAEAILASDWAQQQERVRRGAKTLGKIIEDQCRMALDATGLHHIIDEDGDGDWAVVWDHLHELKPRAERAEDALVDLRSRVRALADEWETAHGDPPVDPSHISVRHANVLRALLDTEADQ